MKIIAMLRTDLNTEDYENKVDFQWWQRDLYHNECLQYELMRHGKYIEYKMYQKWKEEQMKAEAIPIPTETQKQQTKQNIEL